MKKYIVLAFFFVVAFSCGEKKKSSGLDGKKIYKQNCVLCHGLDGKLGANGSKDLSLSKLSLAERKAIIKNGKGQMTALGGILSAEEIEAVAEFSMKFK